MIICTPHRVAGDCGICRLEETLAAVRSTLGEFLEEISPNPLRNLEAA